MDVAVGWFADPIYLGQYPESMKRMLGKRLPEFTAEELKLLKGSSEVSRYWRSEGAKLTTTVLRDEREAFNGALLLCLSNSSTQLMRFKQEPRMS